MNDPSNQKDERPPEKAGTPKWLKGLGVAALVIVVVFGLLVGTCFLMIS